MTDPNQKPPAAKPAAKAPAAKSTSSSEFEYQRNKADERAKFLTDRQAKIEEAAAPKDGGADGDQRTTVKSMFANPPSVRATDGGEPGTRERHPLEVAAELEGKEVEQETE